MEQKHMSRKAALKIVAGSILAAYGLTMGLKGKRLWCSTQYLAKNN